MHTVRFDGRKLKALRGSRSWDQHKLADAARTHGVGITQSQVSRYENGQEPGGRNALALAKALDVKVEELYSDDEDEDEAAVFVPSDSLLDTLQFALDAAREKKARALA